METRKVKILKDTEIARDKVFLKREDGIGPIDMGPMMFLKDEEVAVESLTAHGLVRDQLAEYSGDQEDADPEEFDEFVTANVRNPDVGTADHRDRVSRKLRSERKKGTPMSKEEQAMSTTEERRLYLQDHSSEKPAIEQVKAAD